MSHSTLPLPHSEFENLSKVELHQLADELLNQEPWVIERCVQFVLAETCGLWHGRARAMMCRRLKHCELGRTHRTELANCISNRLLHGNFSEQFKDQLRLAMHLDLEEIMKISKSCLTSPMHHVQRYARWVLSDEHLKTCSSTQVGLSAAKPNMRVTKYGLTTILMHVGLRASAQPTRPHKPYASRPA